MTLWLADNSDKITPELIIFCFVSAVLAGIVTMIVDWFKNRK